MNRICWSGAVLLAALAILTAPLGAFAQEKISISGGKGGMGGTLGTLPSTIGCSKTGEAGWAGNSIPAYARITAGGIEPSGKTNLGNTGGCGEGMNWIVDDAASLQGKILTLTGGSGGAGGYGVGYQAGGNGGKGGDVSMTINAACKAGGNWLIKGGAGGIGPQSWTHNNNGKSGQSGVGGEVALTVNAALDLGGNKLEIYGGDGGSSGVGWSGTGTVGKGNNAGNVTVNLQRAPTNIGSLDVVGGLSGGFGGLIKGSPAKTDSGGNGGSVALTIWEDIAIDGKTTFRAGSTRGHVPDRKIAAGALDGNGGDVTVIAHGNILCNNEFNVIGGQAVRHGDITNPQFWSKGGSLILDASGQNITVLGKSNIKFDADYYRCAGNVTVLTDIYTSSGDMILTSHTGKAEYLTFRTRELRFDRSAKFEANNTVGNMNPDPVPDLVPDLNRDLRRADSSGVYINTLVIGGVNLETGASIDSVALDNSKAVAGEGAGRYGFGGNLRVTGLQHSVADGGNLGQISNLVCELTTDVQAGSIQLEVLNNAVNITNAQIEIVNLGADLESALESGDRITLISQVNNAETAIDEKIFQSNGLLAQDILRIQHSGIDGDSLDVLYLGRELAKGAEHSLAMAIGASNLLRLGGLDLIPSMIDTSHVLGQTNNGNQIEMLVGFSGAHEDFELNSAIRSNRFNLAVGPALRTNLAKGSAIFGLFVETGCSTYAVSHQQAQEEPPKPNLEPMDSQDNVQTYNGHGISHYLGGGALLGFKLNSGLHADASLAWGCLTNDFHPNWAKYADINLHTTYLSAHVRAGYLISLTEKQGLDLYGKLLWHHQNGRVAQLRNEQMVEFEPFSSMRGIVGANYLTQVTQRTSLSAGLAWEYQFRSEQKVFVDGLPVEPARFEGHTAQLNLGVRSLLCKHLSIGLDLQGSVGKRDGFGGNLTFAYSF